MISALWPQTIQVRAASPHRALSSSCGAERGGNGVIQMNGFVVAFGFSRVSPEGRLRDGFY